MKILRLFLYPFALIYGLVTAIRNWLYQSNIFTSYPIPGKSIVIGNLSVGGTGKSPMVDYLIDLLLKNDMAVATLSRGYGRISKGFREVKLDDHAKDSGDEPLMYKQKYVESVDVFVAEERKTGVDKIRKNSDAVILLDDAFQHRKVSAGLQIVLSKYSEPFFKDHMLPAGNLREFPFGIKRADAVVFTKSPEKIDPELKHEFIRRSKLEPGKVFFSRIVYDRAVSLGSPNIELPKHLLLVTGIADPTPLLNELQKSAKVELMQFPDHHNYTPSDLSKIHEKFGTFDARDKGIITTEKDLMRLQGLSGFSDVREHWFVQPIMLKIDREKEFNAIIKDYVGKN